MHSFSMLLADPSRSGKTHFTMRLIEMYQTMIEPSIERVIYVYQQYQDVFETLKSRCPVPFEFIDDIEKLTNPQRERLLLVVDDFMNNPRVEEIVADYFIKFCHQNISVI